MRSRIRERRAVPSLSLGGLPSSVTIGTDVSVGATIVNGFRPTGTTIIRFFGPRRSGLLEPGRSRGARRGRGRAVRRPVHADPRGPMGAHHVVLGAAAT